jgi:predicted RNase H-like nuclease
VLLEYPDAQVVAVDIPIGLPPPYPRRADVDARAFVQPRGSTVFPTYPRQTYEAPTRHEADLIARQLVGKGMGSHGYSMGERILEVDKHLAGRVHEVHPEVSFRELAGLPLVDSKHTSAGREFRRRCLLDAVGDVSTSARGARHHDVLDAAAAAWSAFRIAVGDAKTFPADPRPDEPRIWY